ncbi:NTPase KAP family P-loop domain-containing protein 1 isoform X1 [Triplophysa dalaica]|uniref:NTPase KAP family P-loop domain-containing protein 1 isoform X1 n=1 Tax=Triplophysa dalaica TaxID=1582913 RepID=UPI0024DF40D6|nr:NTPase KAP family P-loop domain-containing protein 1 isoform X1 [Triplophysa dalaica]XP_056590639.1 NTPase KAP family P-loop domain-containing protein 1 isoform X1 [Triplophysa dalaica]XP_056590640.1 NTPase KAP family P-loop domain-containing protein 1 isoform X1 [Triplophysa dalaica]XP_056590641.1 NTPase KAP family P-loop domain-containing protein 1 isoform X1 [Triplophysa dalaica]XP_056590642.1 NTPase KAP family P-loop domain-containing protein 1 isoform X1 [Triplophysa dalaica]XP_0565906
MAIERVTDVPSDNVYAYAISKTLTKVSSPVTVGLYSECHNRINMVLKNIEVHMNLEAERREQRNNKEVKPRSIKPSICDLLSLIVSLLFYRPVWTEQNQKRRNIRYVFVRFSAWHFAGSDMLWAGLVMQLFKAFQKNFGKLQLGLFRIAQYDEENDAGKKKVEDTLKDWRSKNLCCIPIWALTLMAFIGTLLILIPLIIFGFPYLKDKPEGEQDNESHAYGVLEGFAIAVLGVPAAGAVRFIFLLLKNLIFNQDLTVRQGLDNQKVSQQLGLMNEVRKEMRLLCCFIHFMEIFERRKIRVVLQITNLDRCTPRKIVGVLDAVNILLSDEESPLISLLAVDPEVLVRQVDQAEDCLGKRNSAYDFLDRIVTLPFTVPKLCDASKCKVFKNIVRGQSEIPEDFPLGLGAPNTSIALEDECSVKNENEEDQVSPLIAKNVKPQTFTPAELSLEDVDKSIDLAFQHILSRDDSNLQTYISGDTMSMRRVINSIRVTFIIMETLKLEPPAPKKIAAWVVLADLWPCRLSWILQCVEDDVQRAEIDGQCETFCAPEETKTLWEVFNEHSLEFYLLGHEAENFLERDGDPELFEMFLRRDFRFTVGEVKRFLFCTVNLNYSIKNELARIRGSHGLKKAARNMFNTIAAKKVIGMKTEDVCEELSRLDFPEKYLKTVRENFLDGQTILLSNPPDLRQVLQMTLGEWTSFKIHFLGVTPSSRPDLAQSLPKATSPAVVICPSGHGQHTI